MVLPLRCLASAPFFFGKIETDLLLLLLILSATTSTNPHSRLVLSYSKLNVFCESKVRQLS